MMFPDSLNVGGTQGSQDSLYRSGKDFGTGQHTLVQEFGRTRYLRVSIIQFLPRP